MARKKKKSSFVKGVVLFVCLMVPLGAWLGLSKRGILRVYEMDLERQKYMDRIRALKKENKELLDEIRRLKRDPNYVEKVARQELGLIKDNEVIYRFSDLPVEAKEQSQEPIGRITDDHQQ
ncbi:MAG: hypothetical protein DRG71_00540 [Deltaproteobacteria bacterium]|nr:MAG: hypothetical protein DRG71_00540 [Deltaproteobacteria bacterium]HDG97291.1 septum formation initiator family protein [Desulfobacterales bacterium]